MEIESVFELSIFDDLIKRDLYNKNSNLYTNQTKVDDAIENIAFSREVPSLFDLSFRVRVFTDQK
jgi:hypothetical protein